VSAYRHASRPCKGRPPVTFVRGLVAVAAAAALAGAFSAAQARPQPFGNLGGGLRELAEFHAARATMAGDQISAEVARAFPRAGMLALDAQGRVRVDIHLNGQLSLGAVREAADRLGARVVAESATWRKGVITAHVPLAALRTLARAEGVRSVLLSPKPVLDVGATTSQGTTVLKTDKVNAAGILGAGITVGLMSDSYDTSAFTTIRAADDVASGDLPGKRNPNGYNDPVVVIKEQPGGTDEGRAMAQIVHDVAPAAKLCFATAYDSELAFADNIRALADKSGACGADVIVDDIIYLFEPMFSDGPVAQAVDEVAAQGVSYFSSAGNRGSNQAYLSGFRKIDDAAARLSPQTVDLSLVPAGTSDGGFHNLKTGGGVPDLSRTVTLAGATNTVVFQWNDPFNTGGITADYDLYLFNADGTALVAVSGDDNFATDIPVEAVQVLPGTYQVVVVRSDTHGGPADQLRFITFGTVTGGEYLDFKTPGTYGHNSAKGAMGTAAKPWFQPYLAEAFTSLGRGTFYFDADGNRLPAPEIRQKPDIAAPDGGNNTFFSFDTLEDADTLPNFFGTSAAAPHAAGVAALVMEKTGGPGTIGPVAMRKLLQKTAVPQDGTANTAKARAAAPGGSAAVTVVGHGDGNTFSGVNPNAFEVSFQAPEGYSLELLTIDVSNANTDRVLLGTAIPGLQFDPRAVIGFPITLGSVTGVTPADITFDPISDVAPFSNKVTAHFAAGSFTRGDSITFGVDRDEVALSAGGNSMDLLVGGMIRGKVRAPDGSTVKFEAPFESQRFGNIYQVQTGFGLIDAERAVQNAP
jgi:Subtilase family